MIESAIVVKKEHDQTVVSIDKKDQCSKCGMCLFPQNAKSVEYNAQNSLNAKVGDKVLVEILDGGKLTALALIFLVPLLFIIISTVIALVVIKSELWVLWLSIISIGIWFCILPLIDKKLKKRSNFIVKITQIIGINQKENENE